MEVVKAFFLSKFREPFEYDVDFYHQLGQGAFGTVYRGIHRPTNREVALKNLRPTTQAEAEIATHFLFQYTLQHENVVKIFDVKYNRESLWIA